MSTNRKLPWDSLDLQPRSSSALTVNVRTSVLRTFSSSMCFASFSAAIAAAMPNTLML
jgi:hypothetical protein